MNDSGYLSMHIEELLISIFIVLELIMISAYSIYTVKNVHRFYGRLAPVSSD